MAALQPADKSFLESLFGARVSFDRGERKLYGHDTAEIPSLIKPIEVGGVTRWAGSSLEKSVYKLAKK